MDYQEQFTQYESIVKKHGDKQLKRAAVDFRAELDRYQSNLENRDRLRAELEILPTKAATLAAEGRSADELVRDLGGLRGEMEIAEAVCQGSEQRLDQSWAVFMSEFDQWQQSELNRIKAQGEKIAQDELQPVIRETLKAFQKNNQKLEEIELRAKEIANGQDLKQTAEIVGLLEFTRFLSRATAVKLGLKEGTRLHKDTGRPSVRAWGKIRNALERVPNMRSLEPMDEAMVSGLVEYLLLPPDARQPLSKK